MSTSRVKIEQSGVLRYTPLLEVPDEEIRLERPERAMAFSAARLQSGLHVRGAVKQEKIWYAAVDYEGIDGKDYQEQTTPLKRTLEGRRFATLDLGHTPRYGRVYRDVYLEEPVRVP